MVTYGSFWRVVINNVALEEQGVFQTQPESLEQGTPIEIGILIKNSASTPKNFTVLAYDYNNQIINQAITVGANGIEGVYYNTIMPNRNFGLQSFITSFSAGGDLQLDAQTIQYIINLKTVTPPPPEPVVETKKSWLWLFIAVPLSVILYSLVKKKKS